jgi:hypothetical protein
MEHDTKVLLYPQLAIHSVLDVESLCADTRKGEGLEIGSIVFGWKRHHGANCDVDICRQEPLGLDGGKKSAQGTRLNLLMRTCITALLDLLHRPRIRLRAPTASSLATNDSSHSH